MVSAEKLGLLYHKVFQFLGGSDLLPRSSKPIGALGPDSKDILGIKSRARVISCTEHIHEPGRRSTRIARTTKGRCLFKGTQDIYGASREWSITRDRLSYGTCLHVRYQIPYTQSYSV